LLHYVTVDRLRDAYTSLKREAAPGVDGATWQSYKQELEVNLTRLHEQVHRGTYRALPSRRRYIPKPDGRQRPLGIAALEDKIVQRAVVQVLNAIYEEDFLGFSYGFRSGRGQHDALDALAVGITSTKVNWIVDAKGQVIVVRYADDIVMGFQHEREAKRFVEDMRQRLGKFALALHPEKTRLIEFGRFAAKDRESRGLGKPETFNFLGFTHICSRSRRGVFQLKRQTRRDRMRARLRAIKEELRRRIHESIPLQGKWLGR